MSLQDHVSMGATADRKCSEILRNTEHVIAIELLCAAQAMDLFTNMKPGQRTIKASRMIRATVRHLEEDRVLSKDIEAVVDLMLSGTILEEVETAVGNSSKTRRGFR
jgi:histidine ammonia-lyase